MYREEILDMAMDILDNTDATLEEAMGIAIESAENKMTDAEKYRRRMLKAAVSTGDNNERRRESLRQTSKSMGDRDKHTYSGYASMNRAQRVATNREARNLHYDTITARSEYEQKNHKALGSMGLKRDHLHKINSGKIQSNINNYGHKYQTRKGAKEAAIMDTALDFLDMYDVSLEEAIDMAYDYLIG